MNRRWFLGASLAAVGSVFVPQYGGWYRAGSGLLVPHTDRHIVAYSEMWTLHPDGYAVEVYRRIEDGPWVRLPDVVEDRLSTVRWSAVSDPGSWL